MYGRWEPLLTSEDLARLRQHKYSCASLSLIEPKLQPLWNWVLSLTPLWVAPNLITIVGLIINIATTLLLVYCCPTATERAPWWATGSAALGLWLYQTLDAIDGKQARRTGTAGPLGELFDHGCDSASTVFVSLATVCSVRMGQGPGWLLFQGLMATTLFYTAHWRTYVCGTLQFGWIDVTEGQFVVMAVMLVSAAEDAWGMNIWNSQVPAVPWDMTFQTVYLLAGVAIAVNHMRGNLPDCFSSHGQGKDGGTIAGTSVFSPLLPLLLVLVPAVWLATMTPAIFASQPLLYCLLFGIIGSKITNKLIVAHMCKGEMSQLDSSLVAPLVLVLHQHLGLPGSPGLLLLLALVWATADILWYCSGICSEICLDFKIDTFTIPYSKPEESSKKR